jgi:hypothetical protein
MNQALSQQENGVICADLTYFSCIRASQWPVLTADLSHTKKTCQTHTFLAMQTIPVDPDLSHVSKANGFSSDSLIGLQFNNAFASGFPGRAFFWQYLVSS